MGSFQLHGKRDQPDFSNRSVAADTIILGPQVGETIRLCPTFDATATRQKNAERLLKKKKRIVNKKSMRRLNARLL